MLKTREKWAVLIVVLAGSYVVILDTTIVNVALASIGRELNVPLSALQGVISLYTVALAVVTPLAGAVADRVGVKRLFIGSLLGFGVGSLLCALAPNLPLLLTARVLQGLGGGALTPLGAALILRAFPDNERGRALGIFGGALGVAPALGPVLGGAITQFGAWRWIFLANLPVVAVAAFLGAHFLRQTDIKQQSSFDWHGATLVALAFPAVIGGATLLGGDARWGGRLTAIVLLAVGLLALALLVRREMRLTHPVLAVRMLGHRNFRLGSLVAWSSAGAFVGAEFILQLYLQEVRHLGAFRAGLYVLPLPIAFAVTAPLFGRLADRWSPKWPVIGGLALSVIVLVLFSTLNETTSLYYVIILMSLRGIAFGAAKELMGPITFRHVSDQLLARGNSLFSSSLQLSQSLFVVVLGATIAALSTSTATVAGIRGAYFVAAASAAIALLFACMLPTKLGEVPILQTDDKRDKQATAAL